MLDFPARLWYSVGYQKQGGSTHGKNHVERTVLWRQICWMREVVKAIESNPAWENAQDRDAIRELEIVRQTLIASERMKQNGDCIAEEELGGTVAIALSGGEHEKHN